MQSIFEDEMTMIIPSTQKRKKKKKRKTDNFQWAYNKVSTEPIKDQAIA